MHIMDNKTRMFWKFGLHPITMWPSSGLSQKERERRDRITWHDNKK